MPRRRQNNIHWTPPVFVGVFTTASGCIHFSDLEPLTEAQPAGTLLITHARLFDGSGTQPGFCWIRIFI